MAEPYIKCPESWLKGTLEASPKASLIAKVESGGTPSTSNPDYWDGDIPWLTPKEITRDRSGFYVSSTERNITKLGMSRSAAKLMPAGTVLLTKRAPVGAVAINSVPMCVNQGFLCFTCGKQLRPQYLAIWLEINLPYLRKVANGSTYLELYKSDLFEFEIQVPPLEMQNRIVDAIFSLKYAILIGEPLEQTSRDFSATAKINSYTKSLASTCDRLSYLLLSGQIDPSLIQARL